MFGDPKPDAIRVERELKWRQIMGQLDRMTDGLGMPVDPEIKESVAACIAHGFDTYQSCGGHLEHERLRAPWIVIQAGEQPNERFAGIAVISEKLEKRFGAEWWSGAHNQEADAIWYEETKNLPESEEWRQWRMRTQEHVEQMKEMLLMFYEGRSARYPIFIEDDSLCVISIRDSLDISLNKKPVPPDFVERIQGGRKEFEDFGAWLKERFLREGPTIKTVRKHPSQR